MTAWYFDNQSIPIIASKLPSPTGIRQSETTFSGGGDDEGSAAANSVMPALEDGDRGLEGTGSSVGTVEGSVGARCSSSSSSSFLTSSSSLSSSDDSLS
ncbi:hypothetical protein Tco_0005758 [Tanacetum coccineum]